MRVVESERFLALVNETGHHQFTRFVGFTPDRTLGSTE
jgi:hypothetical protein